MKFERLVEIAGSEPMVDAGVLLAGDVDPADVRRQLSRWVAAGRLYQVRRGLYALAPPFQKVVPHPFLVANGLVHGSYVSCQSALAYYGLIPEYVAVVTSVTAARPGRWETPLGVYQFRHVKTELVYGYRLVDVTDRQQAFVATPEKALLDLVYLQPRGDDSSYLQELRLQNLDVLDLDALRRQAERAGSAKLKRAAVVVADMARAEAEEYHEL
jgi:predicted transcriptional regulator of viral defense system